MLPHKILVSVRDLKASTLDEFAKKQLGLELSYFAYPQHLEEATLDKALKYYQKLLNGFPEEVTMHGAFYDLKIAARDPKIVAVCRYRIQQSLDIAQELGIQKVVFHANYAPSPHADNTGIWTQKQVAFWEAFIPMLEQRGQEIFIENTTEDTPHLIKDVLDTLNHPNLKTCYDTGHSHCFGKSAQKPVEWAEVYGKHLGYIHLHSNYGQKDEHLAFPKGTVDFSGFFEYISTMSVLPRVIIEVKTREEYVDSLDALQTLHL